MSRAEQIAAILANPERAAQAIYDAGAIAERERIAKMAEEEADADVSDEIDKDGNWADGYRSGWHDACHFIAARIRDR